MSQVSESLKQPSPAEIPDLFLADWSNLVHRAYHGLGAYGDLLAPQITKMAHDIIVETAMHHAFLGARICFVLDGGLSGRRSIYQEYKANRVDTSDRPPALVLSLEGVVIEDQNYSWRGIPIRAYGYESDDVMIALARHHAEKGGNSLIFSNDSDMLQAVNSRITVLRPRKYPEPPEIFTEQEVLEKYGFPPSKIPHFKALQGDQADNIPRVPRVGEGIAAKLICEYGSVAGVIAAAANDWLTPVVGRNILLNTDNIMRNLKLVTPVRIPNIAEIYRGVMDSPPSIV